jgi:hypothetical protein
MAVQTKILKRTEDFTVPVTNANGEIVQKPTSVATGALVGGVPGQIYDVAFGPVVHTTNLPKAAEIGSYVEGQGVIINAPEYALYGTTGNPLAPSLMLPANSVVSVMTAGHVWIQYKYLAAIQAGMNTFVMWQPASAQADDLCVVEVNGLKPQADADDSTANG